MEAQELRSLRSVDKCHVRFVNKTTRSVDIIWVDFAGRYIKYSSLQRGQFVDITTYKTHPWAALDSNTKDHMLIGGRFRYLPETAEEALSNYAALSLRYNMIPTNVRLIVNITLPMYSLKYKCLLEVRNLLREPDDVDGLELTKNLKHDLKQIIRRRNDLIAHDQIVT